MNKSDKKDGMKIARDKEEMYRKLSKVFEEGLAKQYSIGVRTGTYAAFQIVLDKLNDNTKTDAEIVKELTNLCAKAKDDLK